MNPSLAAAVPMDQTVMGRIYRHFGGQHASTEKRLILIVALALGTHVLVSAIQKISEWLATRSRASKSPFGLVVQQPKIATIHRLIVSAITFAVYFLAFGLILQELGVNLAAYLAGASIIGLTISFGMQSLVQDIVVGITLIFSDAMNVGDLVEISGAVTAVGRVERIGLRFTVLSNFYNQRVMITNRTIANVSRFPTGGIDAFADVWIPAVANPAVISETVKGMAAGMRSQFDRIILSDPVVTAPQTAPGANWTYVRVHFRLWPGQGALIENTFRQEVVRAMKSYDPAYADWQMPVTYRATA